MRRFIIVCALSSALGALTVQGFAQEGNKTSATKGEIEKLVLDLGNEDWRTREAATKRLRELERAPRAQLVTAARSSDPEVARRAQGLLERIKNDEVWDPVKIKISAKSRKISAIVKEIAERTDTPLVFGNYLNKEDYPKDPAVDFQFEGSTWEAVDKLCALADARLVPQPWDRNKDYHLLPRKKAMPAPVYSGNVRVSIERDPVADPRDGFMTVRLKVIGDGCQALIGTYSDHKLIRAVTDSGEVLEQLKYETFSFSPAEEGTRACEAVLKLTLPKMPCTKLTELEVDLLVASLGEQKLIVLDDLSPDALKSDGHITVGVKSMNTNEYVGIVPSSFYFSGYGTRYMLSAPTFVLEDSRGKRVKAHHSPCERIEGSELVNCSAFFEKKGLETLSKIEVRYYTRTSSKRILAKFADATVAK